MNHLTQRGRAGFEFVWSYNGLMRPLALAALVSMATAFAADPVLLSTRREGYIEAFSLDKLETVARVHVKARLEGIDAGPAGDRFFVRAPHPQAAEVCCALWALDARSLRGFAILWPSLYVAQANGKLFTQRGDDGVEVFDTRSFAHLPRLIAPGVYQFAPSPDGRWLFATRAFPTASLDIFDLAQHKLIRTLPVSDSQFLRGIWLGSQYYLLTPGLPGAMRLWSVDPQAEALGSPKLIRIPAMGCSEGDFTLAATDRIVFYTPWGMKPNTDCPPGTGYVLLDPTAGTASPRLAQSAHLHHVVVGPDGKTLYGIDETDPPTRRVQLVKLDAASGQTLASRALPVDVWTLALGAIPAEWQGRMDLEAVFQ